MSEYLSTLKGVRDALRLSLADARDLTDAGMTPTAAQIMRKHVAAARARGYAEAVEGGAAQPAPAATPDRLDIAAHVLAGLVTKAGPTDSETHARAALRLADALLAAHAARTNGVVRAPQEAP